MDEFYRWLIGDIWLPILLCIVTIVVGFIVVKAVVKKSKQKNITKIKGNNNYVVQMNESDKTGDDNDKKSSKSQRR